MSICYWNKIRNLSFDCNGQTRSNDVLELVHTDVNGLHNMVGGHGERYLVTFIDDFSKFAMVHTVRSKDEVFSYFAEFYNYVFF